MVRRTHRIREWPLGRLFGRARQYLITFVLLSWIVGVLRRSRRNAEDVSLSPVRGGHPIGSDYLHRAGFATGGGASSDAAEADDGSSDVTDGGGAIAETDAIEDGAIADARAIGRLADLEAFARDGFDPTDVDREVRRFYERTADYDMWLRVRWGRGFRLGARLAAAVTSRVRQLNLPGRGGDWVRLSGRFVPVSVPDDPREDVRGWIRTAATDATDAAGPAPGEAVFVALYGTAERGGERFVTIAAPVPGGNLSTVLRVRNWNGGLELATAGDGDPGLFLVTPFGPFRLPIRQRFRTRAAGDGDRSGCRRERGMPPDDPDLIATHEMWFLRFRFLTVDYRIERAGS